MNEAVHPLQRRFWAVCEQILMDHTNPWELDEALTDWGYAMGPCEAQDLVGLDVVLAARKLDMQLPILPRMVAEGRLGKKTGWGYYRYPGGNGAVIDPLIEDLILEEVRFAKHPRAALEGELLVDRVHALMSEHVRADPVGAVAVLHFPVNKVGLL